VPIDSDNPINRVTTYCANSTFTLYRYVNATSQKYLDDNSRITHGRFNPGLSGKIESVIREIKTSRIVPVIYSPNACKRSPSLSGWLIPITLFIVLHEKNGFAEVYKNLVKYKSEILLNNFVGPFKINVIT